MKYICRMLVGCPVVAIALGPAIAVQHNFVKHIKQLYNYVNHALGLVHIDHKL